MMLLPVFIMRHHLRQIEGNLLNGDCELDYKQCEGIDPDVYGDYKELLVEHKTMGKKIRERNVNKRLRKLLKSLEFS